MSMAPVPTLTQVEFDALAQLAQELRAHATGPWGVRLHPHAGRGSGLYGHDAWRPGEAPRHLDWRVFLRTGQLWIRRFHAEGDPCVHLWLDTSTSMGSAKQALATHFGVAILTLAAMLGQSFTCCLLGQVTPWCTWHGAGDWQALLRARFGQPLPRLDVALGPAFRRALNQLSIQDEGVLVSDFADPETLEVLRRGRRGMSLVMITAPVDEQLPIPSGELSCPEGRGHVLMELGPEPAPAFLVALRKFRRDLVQTCAARDGVWSTLDTDAGPSLLTVLRRWAHGRAPQRFGPEPTS